MPRASSTGDHHDDHGYTMGASSLSCWAAPSLLFQARGKGWGSWGGCSHLGDLKERYKLPKRDPGRSPAAYKWFSCILEAPDGLSWNLLGAKFGEKVQPARGSGGTL